MRMTSWLSTFLRWPLIPRILLIILFVIMLFGSMIHYIEPITFPSLFDGIWWAIVTTSTIGYGDFVPTSILGRSVAIFLILIGTGFVTTYFVTLSTSAVVTQNAYIEGKTNYKGKGHIVVVGWNERVKETISQLYIINPALEIILIDQTLDMNPDPAKHIHFVKGNQTDDEALVQANVKEASMILITADQSQDEAQADMRSVLTLVAAKGINPSIYCIIEILTTKQVNNAKRAGADEVIQTNTLSSYVMINSVVSHGVSNPLLNMLDQIKGSKLKYIELSGHLAGLSFLECSTELLKKGTLLVGVKRDNESIVNPPASYLLRKGDELFVITK